MAQANARSVGAIFGSSAVSTGRTPAKSLASFVAPNPVFRAFTGHLLGVTGRVENELVILAEGERLWERGYFEPFVLAVICVVLGRTEAALDWLDRAEEMRSSWLTVHAALDSRLDPLRNHPRFQMRMVRMGLR
jgi:hypothetical protein